MIIDQTALDSLVQIYRNGTKKWQQDEFFLEDCAYYEGRIKRACEVLKCNVPFTHITQFDSENLIICYDYGYYSWD